MPADSFSVEITLDTKGVRSVRILGKNWNYGVGAHALLQRLNPLIQKLDAEAKRSDRAGHIPNGEFLQ